MLPHEDGDPQKLQKKRHIGNDIVCVAFLEADDALFWPGCIKSHFLHTFIVVKTTPRELLPDETRKYTVAVVCRDEVSAFKPYLWHQSEFEKVNLKNLNLSLVNLFRFIHRDHIFVNGF